jgi:hypothetical protein
MNLYSICAIFVILAAVGVRTGNAVLCYSCNSGGQYQGDGCSDPLPPSTKAIDCDAEGIIDGKNYTMCRKFTQDVEGDFRIVRSCATSGRPGQCVDRTGTKSIKLRYCECLGDECNSAATNYATVLVTLSSFIVAALRMV